MMLSLATQAALETQRLVGGRSFPIPTQALTPVLVAERFPSTPGIPTQQWAQQHYSSTPLAHKTWLLEPTRLSIMTTAPTTRPSVGSRSSKTQPAASTRPSVLKRSVTTPPDSTTLHWDLPPATSSPRAMIILISATKVFVMKPALCVSAQTEHRQEPLLRELAGSWFQARAWSSMRAVNLEWRRPRLVSRMRSSQWKRPARAVLRC